MPEQSPSISPERRAKVDAARRGWIRQLVDMSRRNNLLYFRNLKVGTLDLSDAPPAAMQSLLQSGRAGNDAVKLRDLVGGDRQVQAAASLADIVKKATSNFEERGLDTLFLGMGLATWTAGDEGRNTDSPVVLVPIEAFQTGQRNGPWGLRRAGDVKLNDVLIHALRQEHGVALDGDALVAEILGDDEGESFDLQPLFEKIRRSASAVPGFDITPRWVLGNFAFQKMAIVKDLDELPDALAAHDIVAAIAGDPGGEQATRGDRTSVDPGEFDRQPPTAEFLIRDADSSQHQAISATLRGQNGVISGPPGTGKSQTISNLIAELVATGKTVLFVAEKRAALDVVLNRLDDAGLGHLCLDCHGAELTRRRVAEQLQESLRIIRDAAQPDDVDFHRKFTERRDQLNAHVRAHHSVRQPGGLTLYQLYGRLLALPSEVASEVRLSRTTLDRLDHSAIEVARREVEELATLSGLFTGQSDAAWVGAALTTPDEVRAALERARRLARELWPAWEATRADLFEACPARAPRTVGETKVLLALLSDLQQTLEVARDGIFAEDLELLKEQLAPGRSVARTVLATLFDGRFRAALRQVRRHGRKGKLPARAALSLVEDALAQRNRWRELAVDRNGVPTEQPRFAAASGAWTAVIRDLQPLIALFKGKQLDSIDLGDLAAWLPRLAADATTPSQVLKLHGIVNSLTTRGLGPVLNHLRSARPASALWPDVLSHAWLSSCIEEIQLDDPSVPSFNGRRHDQIVEEFKALDRNRLDVAVSRVQYAHALKALRVRNEHAGQNTLVTREAQKKSRHLPLRQLFAQAPDVLLALRPCWMASPLSASQLIPGDVPRFDVVLFDEASQVLPQDAITSILRGRQTVIAGDQRQLPPTTFFAAGETTEDADEGEETTQGFQSILDVMTSFLEPAWSLDWHYRSRDEALIAYSNHRIYGGRLVTFPGPGGIGAVRHELVQHLPGAGAQEASVAAEVRRVVELVQEHVRTRPDESLGVITMGIEHARRIEMALDRARQEDPALDEFFSPHADERFFVKNLERVQGDERDAILLSIGYGKSDSGQLIYRFGPLLQDGGERRLNVAITRARQRMTVVSSFSHLDMQADYPKLGVRLLRGFLEYAASGGRRLGGDMATDVPLNDFEQSVSNELTRRGLTLVGQLGCSRYRIDLAAVHPQQPGRFVLAIECDGASYHSAPTARDRDRLRQQQLEALGWRFHRIWSTDWFLRKDEEVERALRAFEDAVAWADRNPEVVAPADTELIVNPVGDQAPVMRTRGPRPAVPQGDSIDDYTSDDLRAMVRWVRSDGRLHTNKEIVHEVSRALGFRRTGRRIVEAVERAIAAE